MPEENYNFKPTEAARSFGQIVGHIADSQYFFCSIVLGEKNPAPGIEQSRTSLTIIGPGTRTSYRFVRPGARVLVDGRDRASLATIPVLRRVSG